LVCLGFICAALGIMACGSDTPPSKFNTRGDAPNEACTSADVCVVWGWCGEKDGKCVAATDQGCKDSRACKVSGLCSFLNGRCEARNDDDCANSQYCKWNGLCSQSEGLCK